MKILVNGQPLETQAQTLSALLEELDFGQAKVATALNGELAAKSKRAKTFLKEGDSIEIIAPMQGG